MLMGNYEIKVNFGIANKDNPDDKTAVIVDAPLTKDEIESIDDFERILLRLDRTALRKLRKGVWKTRCSKFKKLWIMELIRWANDWLVLLYAEMKETLIDRDILYADETTLRVLKYPNKAHQSKSYRWLY